MAATGQDTTSSRGYFRRRARHCRAAHQRLTSGVEASHELHELGEWLQPERIADLASAGPPGILPGQASPDLGGLASTPEVYPQTSHELHEFDERLQPELVGL